jgi:HEAT repeats
MIKWKTILYVSIFSSVSIGLTRADDKSRFSLSKLNPLNRFKKEEPVNKAKAAAEILRTDPDEKKRVAAAEDIADADAKLVGEAMPTLIASLKQDPSATVRTTVATSIGKIKAITPAAGVVLESAAANDPSEAVRKASQTSLNAYLQNGYRPTTATVSQTLEPPLAKPRPQMPSQNAKAVMVAPPQNTAKIVPPAKEVVPTGINRGPSFNETTEPPLAKKISTPPITEKTEIESPPVAPPKAMPVMPAPASMPRMPSPEPSQSQMPVIVPPPPQVIQIPTPMPIPNAPQLPAPLPLPKAKELDAKAPSIPVPTPPPSGSPNF